MNTQKYQLTDLDKRQLLSKKSLAKTASGFLLTGWIIQIILGVIVLGLGGITLSLSSSIHTDLAKTLPNKTKTQIDQLFNKSVIVLFVAGGLCLFSMVWLIPMQKRAHWHSNNPKKKYCLVLGICSIIFVGLFGLVAGILLIIADGKTRNIVIHTIHEV